MQIYLKIHNIFIIKDGRREEMSWAVSENWGISKKEFDSTVRSATEECEHERGYFEPITNDVEILSGVYKDKDAAKEAMHNYISKHHGESVAVSYYDTCLEKSENKKLEKKAKELREKAKNEIAKLTDYSANHLVTLQKAKFVSCPECESKLRKDRLRSERRRISVVYHMRNEERSGLYVEGEYELNICPVCNAVLQNETVQNTIRAKREKINATLTEYQDYTEKIKYNPKKEKKIFYGIYIQTYLG